jgi:spore germination protein
VFTIAQRYGVPYTKIINDNELTNPNRLVVGQSLVVDAGYGLHTVQPGESIYSIAQRYGLTVNDIIKSNPQISNPNSIMPGQVLIIKPGKIGTIEVNGYVYPSVKNSVLEKTLPNLTYISIFSYQVNEDGSLDSIDDERIINMARNYNVAPIMVINNRDFSSDVAKSILNSEESINNLLNNILNIMNSKGYYGLNIDFEYVYPEDREKYNEFLLAVNKKFENTGYKVFTSLAPKISKEQIGTLYEAHDYSFHGKTVDRIIIMTYEWGYLYGPPLPVAPINEVKRVLDYAVTEIPSEKILMGMPNYGYDWTLPYVSGTTATILTNKGAEALALNVLARINYDPKAQSPFFRYYDANRKEHIVWFEDARSIRAKLLLVNQYNLAGVSYWTLNNYYPQNWLILNSLYDVKKVI